MSPFLDDVLLFIVYALCSFYLLVVTNQAIDRAQKSFETDPERLPKESFKAVTRALAAKSVFLLGLILVISMGANGDYSDFSVRIGYAIFVSFVFGGVTGGLLGVVVGFAAFVGAAQSRDWNKKLPLLLQAGLHLLLALLVLL